MAYIYDPSGRRIEKDIDGDKTTYVYDGGNVIAEYDDGVLARKFIHGAGVDEVVCMINVADNNAVYYYHYDGSGSVVALSDANGVTVQTYEYSAYGQVAASVAASDPNFIANPYMFTSRRFDFETGLYYYRARYYNPYIGRFLQTDPIGYGDGINWYAYCGNNPTSKKDPSGLDAYIIFYPLDEPDEDGLHPITHVAVAVDTAEGVLYRDYYPGEGVRKLRGPLNSIGERATLGDFLRTSEIPPLIIGFNDKNGSDEAIADFLRSGESGGALVCGHYAYNAVSAGGYNLYTSTWIYMPMEPPLELVSGPSLWDLLWPYNFAKECVRESRRSSSVYVLIGSRWPLFKNYPLWEYDKDAIAERIGDELSYDSSGPGYNGYAIDSTGATYWVSPDGIEYKGHVSN